ncbi:hypothetical protein GCM10027048_04810 [Hymenobacter coalescens]
MLAAHTDGVLTMLSLLSGYGCTRDAEAIVQEGLRGTDKEADVWFAYDLSCNTNFHVDLANDNEDSQ